ncbi:MAG: TerB family tellurite resistance protein [Pseudomonadota bacterium]
MFDRLISALTGAAENHAVLKPEDARDAMAVILVHAARADGVYDADEQAHITRILSARYGLDAEQAEALRQEAEAAEERAAGLQRFTSALKSAVPFDERLGIIEAVWEIAYADGEETYQEAALVRKLCGLLYVPDRDAGITRREVAARLGIDAG